MTRNSVAQLNVSEEVRCPTSPKMLFHVSERACLVSGDRKGISVGFEIMMNATPPQISDYTIIHQGN